MEKITVSGILREKREISIEKEKNEFIKGWNLVLYWEVLNKKGEIVPFFRKVAAFGDYFYEFGKSLKVGDALTAIGSTKIGKYKNEKAKKIVPTLEVIADNLFKVGDVALISEVIKSAENNDDEEDYE